MKLAKKNINATLSVSTDGFKNGVKSASTSLDSLRNNVKSTNSSMRELGASAQVSKWKNELTAVNVDLVQSKSNLSNIKVEQQQTIAAVQKARSAVNAVKLEQEQLNQKIKTGKVSAEDAAKKQEQLNSKLKQANATLGQTKLAQQEVKVRIDSAKAAISEARAKQEELNRKIQEGERGIKAEENAQENFNSKIDNSVNKQDKSQSGGASSIVGAAQAVSGSALASYGARAGRSAINFTKDAVSAFSGFQSAMSKVQTLADTTVVSISDLGKGIRNISSDTGKSATELSEAMYQAISAGVDTGSVLGFIETANKAAVGGFTDTATAVDGLSSVLNTYGMSASSAGGLANQFLITQNKGKTTFGELASSIGKVAPVANSAGVGISDLLSSVAALTANGIATSEAMTGIKAALSNVIKPSTEASKMAKKLGLEFSVSAIKTKGFAGFLQDVKEKTGGNLDTMGKLFGSVEGLNSVLTLTGDQGMALMSETMQEMSNNTTALDDAFSTMQGTASAKMGKLNQSFENFKISIGDNLAEPLSRIVDFASGAVQMLEPLAPLVIGVVTAVGLFGAMSAIAGVITAVSGAMTALGISSAAALGPFLLIPLIVGGVVAAIVLVAKNWDVIKEKAGQCWNAIKGFFGGVGEWFGAKWNAVKEGAMSLWDGVTQKWEGIKEKAFGMWDNFKNAAGVALDATKTYLSPKLDSIKQVYEEHGGGFKGVAAGIMEGVKQYYSVGFDALNTITGGKAEAILSTAREKFNAVKDSIVNAFNSAKDAVSNIFDSIKNKVSSVWDGIKNLIKTPHIVQRGTISIAGINTPIPNLGIEWNAKGGIFNRPTVLPTMSGLQGFGEAGAEAVLPLSLLWSNMGKFIRGALTQPASNGDTKTNNKVTINIYAENKSVNQITNELVPALKAALANM